MTVWFELDGQAFVALRRRPTLPVHIEALERAYSGPEPRNPHE